MGINENLHEWFKAKSLHVNGAPECMRISGFMHGITNPDLIKRLNDNIPKSVDEMMSITTAFLRGKGISFPPLANSNGQENPIVIEAKFEGHLIYCMYVDGGPASEVLYEHCFNMLRPEVKSRMIPATMPFLGFSGEISWPLGHISSSSYNDIIGRLDLRKIQAVPSTAHELLRDLPNFKENKHEALSQEVHLRHGRRNVPGHVVNMKGIKACPDKAEAVTKLQSLRTLKEVQSLNEKLESLNRLLSKSTKKAANGNRIRPKEELIIFLCAASDAVSTVLLTKRDSQQMPVYFVSRALQALKISYSLMEKLELAMVHALRTLRRYLQAHSIAVITDQPIKQILSRPKNAGRMLKRKFKLDAFDITYRPRTSIRGQVLADFIAKRPDEDGSLVEVPVEEVVPDPWTLFTNGSSCLEGLGVGLILTNSKGVKFAFALRFASIKHPKTNGHVERVNCSLGEGIKERLVEIGMPSLRYAKINQAMNDEPLLLNLDIMKRRRKKQRSKKQKSKAKMERYYNAKVHNTTFKPGNFVYRSNKANHAKDDKKLGPKWEGPYEVVEALKKGAYKIRNSSGDILPRTWNIKDLKKCYL
nr:reverse transcriptase domain-containing protein [Tanacetum cinerariifolium]